MFFLYVYPHGHVEEQYYFIEHVHRVKKKKKKKNKVMTSSLLDDGFIQIKQRKKLSAATFTFGPYLRNYVINNALVFVATIK